MPKGRGVGEELYICPDMAWQTKYMSDKRHFHDTVNKEYAKTIGVQTREQTTRYVWTIILNFGNSKLVIISEKISTFVR